MATIVKKLSPTAAIWLFIFAVPFSLKAEDEGKVIESGALHHKTESNLISLMEKSLVNTEEAREYSKHLGLTLHRDTYVLVDIQPEDFDPKSIDSSGLLSLGVRDFATSSRWARALIPIQSLEDIVKAQGVAYVSLPIPSTSTQISKATSEGVAATGAADFHAQGIQGAGVKVAIIDLGFEDIQAAMDNGEFGNVGISSVDEACTKNYTTLQNGTSEVDIGGDHGTLVAQIVHDMAPESTLCLKMVGLDFAGLEMAVDDILNEGIDIAISSIGRFNDSYYDGTGDVATIISKLEGEAVWINAAGNASLKHWKGQFVDTDNDGILEFSDNPFSESNISLSNNEGPDIITLHMTWDDWKDRSTDYDIFLLKKGDCERNFDITPEEISNMAVARGDGIQGFNRPPRESLTFLHPSLLPRKYCMVVTKKHSGGNKDVTIFWPTRPDDSVADFDPEFRTATHSTTAPATHESIVAVGALSADSWPDGAIEAFSSKGPRNTSVFTELLLTKPDIVAPTNVSVFCDGFLCSDTFTGTSAAAPHVAGCAALMLSENPGLSSSQLRHHLINNATDKSVIGKDNDFGAGLLNCTVGASLCQDDILEDDDSCQQARNPLNLNIQGHSHCDEDWVTFDAFALTSYLIEAEALGSKSDPVIEIYEGDVACSRLLRSSGDNNSVGFTPSSTGTFKVRVKQRDEIYGPDRDYVLSFKCTDNCPADISPFLADNRDPVSDGDIVVFQSGVMNHGPGEATAVRASISLPKQIRFQSSDPSGICTFDGASSLDCHLGTIASEDSVSFEVTGVASFSSVHVIEPNSGSFSLGGTLTVEWGSNNIFPTDTMTLSIKRDSVPASQAEPDGVNWVRFTTSAVNDGSEVVLIPEVVQVASDWRFYVRHNESGIFDGSDLTVTITEPGVTIVTVLDPNGPGIFSSGDDVLFRWFTENALSSDLMTLSMKRDSVPPEEIFPDGVNWIRFASSTANDSAEQVTIPADAAIANDWRFYVGHNGSGVFDGSNSVLQIAPTSGIMNIQAKASIEVATTIQVSSNELDPDIANNIAIEKTTILDEGDDLSGIIDIKPGSDVNPINPRSRGKIPVAILSSSTFNATTELDRFSFTFGRTGDEPSLHRRGSNDVPNCGEEDVNEDGFVDLVCHFFTQVAGFQEGDTKGFLKGQTTSGESFEAMDGINIVPPGHDSDSDGVDDDVEDEGPNNGDANGDGRFDAFQSNVATLRSAVSIDDFITLQSSSGCTIAEARAFHPQILAPDPSGLVAPQGFISFVLESCGLSDTVVFFHGETSLTGSEYRRLGPTPDDQSNHWYGFENATFGTAMIDGATVATARFQLRDGELGDDDLTLNGRIVDPGGPARNAALDEIPTLNELGLAALILLLLGIGIFVIARRRSSAV